MDNNKSKFVDLILAIISLIIGCLLSIICFVGIEFIQKKIFLTNDYMFFTFKSPASYLVFIFAVEIIVLVFVLLNKFRESIIWQWTIDIYKFSKKHLKVLATLNILLLYISLTSVAVVTPNKIINHTCYNPIGTVYSYDDAVDVNSGSYGDKISFLGDTCGGYYKIKFKDNKVINFKNIISRYSNYKGYE